jgi:hypothetical protein
MPTIEQVVEAATTFNGKQIVIEELSGGLTNTNYLVTADGVKHVVRSGEVDRASRGRPSQRAA